MPSRSAMASMVIHTILTCFGSLQTVEWIIDENSFTYEAMKWYVTVKRFNVNSYLNPKNFIVTPRASPDRVRMPLAAAETRWPARA